MSGQVRSVICSWILDLYSCVGALGASSGSLLPTGRLQRCRLKINSVIYSLLCAEGLLKFSIPSSEGVFFCKPRLLFFNFFCTWTAAFSSRFSPVFKKGKCGITDASQVKARGEENNLILFDFITNLER